MRKITKVMIFIFFVIALSVISISTLAAEDFTQQQKIESHLIINLFLDAVERGELMVFERILTRNMLEPVNISYIYEIQDDAIAISIYSKLLEPMVVPHYELFYINGISVTVDESGNIILVNAHVLPELAE